MAVHRRRDPAAPSVSFANELLEELLDRLALASRGDDLHGGRRRRHQLVRHRLRHRLWLALVFGLARIDGRLRSGRAAAGLDERLVCASVYRSRVALWPSLRLASCLLRVGCVLPWPDRVFAYLSLVYTAACSSQSASSNSWQLEGVEPTSAAEQAVSSASGGHEQRLQSCSRGAAGSAGEGRRRPR